MTAPARVEAATKRPRRGSVGAAVVITCAAVVALLGGCTTDSSTQIRQRAVLSGLPPAVVEEVLSSKAVAVRTASLEAAGAETMLQGITLNFILCRQAYDAYSKWISLGMAPTLPSPTRPDHPDEIAYADYLTSRAQYVQALGSGDAELLRSLLLNDSGCGAWIPVHPGDQAGLTIADAVRR